MPTTARTTWQAAYSYARAYSYLHAAQRYPALRSALYAVCWHRNAPCMLGHRSQFVRTLRATGCIATALLGAAPCN